MQKLVLKIFKPCFVCERLHFLNFTAKSEGRPCEFAGNIYQNGENFKPNCKHQCTCIDGVVGCMPLCPQEFSLPTLDCPKPRLVKVPGQCCEEWACDTNHIGEDSADSTEENKDSMSYEEIGDQPDAEPLSSKELTELVRAGLQIEPGKMARIFSLCSLTCKKFVEVLSNTRHISTH